MDSKLVISGYLFFSISSVFIHVSLASEPSVSSNKIATTGSLYSTQRVHVLVVLILHPSEILDIFLLDTSKISVNPQANTKAL